MYGIYDTKDNVWLGDENGPIALESEILARLSAEAHEVQVFGSRRNRYEARELPASTFTKRDNVKVKMSGEEAIRKMEEGEV